MFLNKCQISHLSFSHLVSGFFLKVMPLEPPGAGQSRAHLWSLVRDTVRCMDFTTPLSEHGLMGDVVHRSSSPAAESQASLMCKVMDHGEGGGLEKTHIGSSMCSTPHRMAQTALKQLGDDYLS